MNLIHPNGECKKFKELEKEIIATILKENDWSIPRTAEDLGLSIKTIYNKIKRHGIERP